MRERSSFGLSSYGIDFEKILQNYMKEKEDDYGEGCGKRSCAPERNRSLEKS